MCVLVCIDTGEFVYSSLSRTLFPTICTLIMMLTYIIYALHKRLARIDKIQIYMFVWLTFIMLHNLFVAEAEQYQQLYFVCTLLFTITLTSMLREELLSEEHAVNGIILIAVIHVAVLTLQYTGIISSTNPYFRLTGADDNPNVTAIALTISIPFICSRIFRNRNKYKMTVLLFFILYFIIALRCRTAIVGGIVILLLACYRLNITQKGFRKIKDYKYKVLIAGIIVTFITGLAFIGYNWKKPSADGRIFIWQRSCEMIVSSPLGSGYGLFERNYNLYQSHYYSNNEQKRKKSTLATACGSAYNDIIEHGVQGGVIGGMLYAGFLLITLRYARHTQKRYMLYAMIAITIMSFTNSICYSITPWIMTITITSLIAKEIPPIRYKQCLNIVYIILLSAISLALLYNRIKYTDAQLSLKDYNKRHICDIDKISDLQTAIGTSEAYWRYLAECYELAGDNKSADKCYINAMRYTTSPLVLYKSAICKERIGETTTAIHTLTTACNMLPANLSLKYNLMKMYCRTHDKKNARTTAVEILTTPIRKENETVLFIRNEAEQLLKEQAL